MTPTAPEPARHPRAEAQRLVGDRVEARVLEPSPPASVDGDFFADDPVGGPPAGRPVLAPLTGADVTWAQWLGGRPEHAPWAADRWLGAYRRLAPPPSGFVETRLGLQRLAAYVLSPARRRVNGKIGLRWTRGGFGTPFFGADEQVRVEGHRLVRQRQGTAASEPISTLRRAATFVLDGPPDLAWAEGFDVPAPGDPGGDLAVDAGGTGFLADWFGFAWSVLEELRADPGSAEAGRVQLWPEHFDAAFDALSGAEERRAGFGASPGDAAVGEPYLYVLPWHFDAQPRSDLWDAVTFRGAILPLSAFVDAPDQRAAALGFLRSRRALLLDAPR